MSEATGPGIVVDAKAADRLKADRLVRLHTIEIPVLRVIGMALVSTGPPVYDFLIRGEVAWGRWLTYAVAINAYALISWAVLYWAYRRVPWLAMTCLIGDYVPLTLLIYATGGDQSWLFFVLTMRVADQTNATFRRAVAFVHVGVLAYVGMLLYMALVDHHPVAWGPQAAKVFFLWGASMYIASFALATERRRATTAAAIRMARESITTLRDRSEQLEEAKRRAEAASRAKTQFLASVSHELRTPLNAIIGFSQILKGKANQVLTGKETAYAETILSSARHLLSIVTDILDLSRIDMGRETLALAMLSLADVARDVAVECEGHARERSVRLDIDLSNELPQIRADRVRLKQILTNLVVNAIKFTPAGGRVRVEAWTTADDAGSWLRVCVADTGIGVRPADQERIFLAFEQIDPTPARRSEGLGVGLALVRRLVDLHGGRIWVESDGIPGAGSRFIFTLPAGARVDEGVERSLIVRADSAP